MIIELNVLIKLRASKILGLSSQTIIINNIVFPLKQLQRQDLTCIRNPASRSNWTLSDVYLDLDMILAVAAGGFGAH